ncbi:MAG: M48 family metallopeptidase [Verrucomicrobiia bacterium]
MSLFFSLGRSLGHAAIPAIKKSKAAWQSLTGSGPDAVLAETEFGKSLAAELRFKMGVADSPEDLDLVRPLLERLRAGVRDKRRNFRVEILMEATPTAMALPGGFLFVSRGLIQFCERDPDELAFLIGHEMGHVVLGHALERMLTRIGSEGLSAVLSRGLLMPALRDMGLRWLESSHTADAEFEADELAVRLAILAGFSADNAVRLLERLAKQRESGESAGAYFASHPPEAERIARIQEVARSARANPSGRAP